MEKFLQAVKDFCKLIQQNRGSPDVKSLIASGEKDVRTALNEVPEEEKIEAYTQAVSIMAKLTKEENELGLGNWLKYELVELQRKENSL